MKLDELKKIIKEELKSILEANAPEKEEKKTKEKEKEKQGTTPRRRGFDKPEPGVNPKPKASLEETEKNLVDKITARFLKSKK